MSSNCSHILTDADMEAQQTKVGDMSSPWGVGTPTTCLFVVPVVKAVGDVGHRWKKNDMYKLINKWRRHQRRDRQHSITIRTSPLTTTTAFTVPLPPPHTSKRTLVAHRRGGTPRSTGWWRRRRSGCRGWWSRWRPSGSCACTRRLSPTSWSDASRNRPPPPPPPPCRSSRRPDWAATPSSRLPARWHHSRKHVSNDIVSGYKWRHKGFDNEVM